ncbi:hypothetical protein HYFRA_00002704 [Hymenoscyphus fraxineus]|uniref:Uncharacterized protein n=1 Tax=Hymenoscyphus fraxineus TaxID=746836 RepID=A0A9N9PVB0_9HELO|nr:hypothetical protein HYFRA_00002704 [Hymenoscyphus fraxineus]
MGFLGSSQTPNIRDNFLTDITIQHLLSSSFQPSIPLPDALITRSRDENLFSHPPPYRRHWEVDTHSQMGTFLAKARSDSLSGIISYLQSTGNLLQSGPVLDVEDGLNQPTGLTHLYISGNKLSRYSAEDLLYQNRLLVLDLGAIQISPPQALRVPYTMALGMVDPKPLNYEMGCRLQSLRIHHSIVTSIPTILPSSSQGYQKPHLHHAELSPTYLNESGPFLPGKNHGIETLTLTHLPKTSYGPTITRLTAFLDACAQQEALLNQVKEGMVKNRRGPEVLPGLRVLRLEFLRPDLRAGGGGVAASGDEDAERFLAESEGDFSFFEEAGGARDERQGSGKGKKRFEAREEEMDVVECLKGYRRENKGWSGKLEIVFM